MTTDIVRNKRLRKKLYLEEFAVKGFTFSCSISVDDEAAYEAFFDSFAELVESRNLFVSLEGHDEMMQGSVSSAERYGSTTAEDREAIEKALTSNSIVSNVVVSDMVDAYYEM